MDNKVIIKPSVYSDIYELMDNLRAEDTAECKACDKTPAEALTLGYMYSHCYSAKVRGKTEAMFGISSYKQPEGYGVIWYLGSDESFKHPIALVRYGREYTNKWLQHFKIIYNAVDARNIRHIAWLKHIGFTFTESIDINGYKFLQFYKIKE